MQAATAAHMEPSFGKSPTAERTLDRRKLLCDALIVLAITAAAALLCIRFNINELLFDWTRRFEHAQFDELPMVLLILAIGFVWFAARRYREAGVVLAGQRRIDARLSAALAENRRLAQQYLGVQEAERKKLARELHDELGQYLNAIKIDAVSMRDGQSDDATTIADMSGAIVRNVDHVYAVVTELIRRLRPVGLDELGLSAAIEHDIEQWRRRLPDVQITLATQGEFGDLGEQAKLTAYRIVQESLTNIAKHAEARHVSVQLTRSQVDCTEADLDEMAIRIADDGRGTDLRKPTLGFGLAGMRERVEMQGGRFEVRSSSARGFELCASFPA